MEQSERQKYKLPENEHERIGRIIEQEVFRDVRKDDKPIAIIAGGQSGSGKGAVISYSKRQIESARRDVVIITTDEYKPFHPRAIELAKTFPTEYVNIIEQDAGLWTGRVLNKAIEQRYNFIFECTLKNERILEKIKELNQNGFSVVVRALAVPQH